MDRKQLIWPNEWPLLPNSARPFVWQCCANDVKWVSHNKCFFFQAQSCLAGQPLLPQLLMCVATDGSRRVERFRIVDSKFVGVGYINQFGNIKGQTADTVMVEVGLIRVEKPEYELLVKEAPDFKNEYEAKMRHIMKHFNSIGGVLALGCLEQSFYVNELDRTKDEWMLAKKHVASETEGVSGTQQTEIAVVGTGATVSTE